MHPQQVQAVAIVDGPTSTGQGLFDAGLLPCPCAHPVSLRGFEEDLFSGNRDANLRFSRMRTYLARLGFLETIHGSHHLFYFQGLKRPLNLQNEGGRCKSYQVRQVRNVLRENRLRMYP